jgi:hypothetical protein
VLDESGSARRATAIIRASALALSTSLVMNCGGASPRKTIAPAAPAIKSITCACTIENIGGRIFTRAGHELRNIIRNANRNSIMRVVAVAIISSLPA